MRILLGVMALAVVTAGCGQTGTETETTVTQPAETTTTPERGRLVGLTVETVATDLSFPVWAVSPPGDDDRLFAVEKTGAIRQVVGGAPAAEPYLDLTRFITADGLEQGLLGLAFHPDFADNRRLFVSFTNIDGHTRILEYREDPADSSRVDPGTGRRLLALDQPQQYHNNGMIQFGPDGMLWIGLGDGGVGPGGIGDPSGHGQNPHALYGSLLRVDVDADRPYAIPEDNPFADGVDGAAEVWAYGFRNPWRFSFGNDDVLFVADVGQEDWEEINVLDPASDAGGNYGWSVMEGPDCFEAERCEREGLIEPDLPIPHVRTCAVIGGPVYQGAAIPELRDHLFYADYCVGWVRTIRWDGTSLVDGQDWEGDLGGLGRITSMAKDPRDELLILTEEGDIFRVVPRRQ